MAIFESFFGKRTPENPANPDRTPAGEITEPRTLNHGPQEPVLPEREALEVEAKELFVPKKEQAQDAQRQERHQERQASYAGDAEVKDPPPLEAAMTKARSEMLDSFSRIQRAGSGLIVTKDIAANENLRDLERLLDATAQDPKQFRELGRLLADAAGEAARLEFEEAERQNPIIELRRIFQKAVDEAAQLGLTDIQETFKRIVMGINEQAEEFSRESQKRRIAILQQGGDATDTESIVNQDLSFNSDLGFPCKIIGSGSFSPLNPLLAEKITEIIDGALKELAVFSGGDPVPLRDLIQAVRDSRRREPRAGLPYTPANNLNTAVGLKSTKPELEGLFLNISRQLIPGTPDTTISFLLLGDKNFWLRVARNTPEIR